MKVTNLTPDATGLVEWPTLSTGKRSIVTVGVFDGMHRGHRTVIRRVVELAKKHDAISAVVMFDPRPGVVHGYAKTHDGMEPPAGFVDALALTGVDQRLRVMQEMGVDHVLVVRYTLAFAAKSYRFFLGQMVGKLGMRTMVLGEDAALGANRAGDLKAINLYAQAFGVFELDVVDDRGPGHVRVPVDAKPQMPAEPGEPKDPTEGMSKAEKRAWSKKLQAKDVRVWSSTNVRYMLSQGRVQAAAEILGEPHGIEGTVVHGEERGRTIGFPTANLGSDIEGYIPVDGVYAGWLIDLGPSGAAVAAANDDETAETVSPAIPHTYDPGMSVARLAADSPYRWPAAISIGTKPTFSEKTGLNERVVEAYAVTDDWLDLYDHDVRVEFAGFLRPQVRFAGADELAAELRRNVQETLRITAR
ncbi:riboflavin kinase [Bifidobacterium leontopitheci]|uniref:Bifunctional riboflavin kinase/FMN adenylyltransferase n=1 Tax=Bifidobacterium leontopitheci TaxID=2650774 RepID=A0A6I1GGR6_9BIFI|nr:riboflavin kinase [Bifidobacterium leontopitheci]KAB7790840.1 bifunctional riboflavin kinase/FMN adenylyltransferase [Bifidobacterium leontopitheci]